MSKLNDYVEKVKQYKQEHPDLTEIELIKYVYLDLGQRFSFNIDFIPFGNTKKRQEIYFKSKNLDDLEECMSNNTIICKSIAYILEYILKALGVDIITQVDPDDIRRFPHVYNIVTSKNGKYFIIDLQNDMCNIQSHSFTCNFGLSVTDGQTLVIPRFTQEQMDRKIGYINDESYYADEYLYLLKSDIGLFDDFGEKVQFVLENIDIFENPNIQYANRMWHHARILEALFSQDEFKLSESSQRIRMVDCYKDINGKRKYIQCMAVMTKNGTDVYIYDEKSYKYNKMNLKNFARAVRKGLIIHNCKVPGLKKAMEELNNEGR